MELLQILAALASIVSMLVALLLSQDTARYAAGIAVFVLVVSIVIHVISRRQRTIFLRLVLDSALRRALREIAEASGAKRDELGFHVYLRGRRDLLRRVARVRDTDTPPTPRAAQWRVGDGVVGICARKAEAFAVDLADPRYRDPTEKEWKAYDESITTNMSLQHFLRATSHFKVIGAVPIVHPLQEDLLGVLSVNLDRESPLTFSEIWSDRVRRILRSEASTIAVLVPLL